MAEWSGGQGGPSSMSYNQEAWLAPLLGAKFAWSKAGRLAKGARKPGWRRIAQVLRNVGDRHALVLQHFVRPLKSHRARQATKVGTRVLKLPLKRSNAGVHGPRNIVDRHVACNELSTNLGDGDVNHATRRAARSVARNIIESQY